MNELTVQFESIARDGLSLTVAATIAGLADKPYRLWYRVPGDHEVDDLAMAHAFAVSVINQAMAVGRDLVIDGPLTRALVMNLEEYQRAWAAWEPRKFRPVAVRARSLVTDEHYRAERGAILPYSGGLDSSYSAMMLAQIGALDAMVTIQGLDISLTDRARWEGAVSGMSACAQSLGKPLLLAATNWQETAARLPGYLGFFLPTVAVAVLLSRGYGHAIIPSSYPYDRLMLPLETNPVTDPLLGRPGFPVRQHGVSAHRIDKVAAIASWPEALRYLRPCDATTSEGTACAKCRKCIQTALAFCALGLEVPPALGGKPPEAEDIKRFEMTPYAQVGLQDALAAARRRGATDPWIAVAKSRVAEFEVRPPLADEVNELRRRLDYVLGGVGHPAPVRTLRRIRRALRGKTGPRNLGARPDLLHSQPRVRSVTTRVAEPAFAVSPRGRRIYVDPEDLRGLALIEKSGDLDPPVLRMWRHLVASQPWTHIIDVGANYGEMLVDLDIAVGTRTIAVEPNPHICWYLERTLREAGLPIEMLQKAVSDRDGTVALTIDRTWSGMSGATIHPIDTAGHRLEPIRVEATTLRRLLERGAPDSEKRVLVKLDVEGHERVVLRGLGGAASTYASFAALVEIHHLADSALADLMRWFSVELFDTQSGSLVPIPERTLVQLSRMLGSGAFHARDVVLRAAADTCACADR